MKAKRIFSGILSISILGTMAVMPVKADTPEVQYMSVNDAEWTIPEGAYYIDKTGVISLNTNELLIDAQGDSVKAVRTDEVFDTSIYLTYGTETNPIPAGEYEVSYWIPKSTSTDKPDTRSTWILDNDVEITDKAGTYTKTSIKPEATFGGWVSLGEYEFAGDSANEKIKVTVNNDNNIAAGVTMSFESSKVRLTPITGYDSLLTAVNAAATAATMESAVINYGGELFDNNALDVMEGAYKELIVNRGTGYTSVVAFKKAFDTAVENQLRKVTYNNTNNILSYNGTAFRRVGGNLLYNQSDDVYFITTFKNVDKQNVKRAEIKIPYKTVNSPAAGVFKLTKTSSAQYDRPSNDTFSSGTTNYQAATAFAAGFTAVTEAQQMQVFFTPKEIDASLFTGEDGYFSLYFEKGAVLSSYGNETPLGDTAELTVWYDNTAHPADKYMSAANATINKGTGTSDLGTNAISVELESDVYAGCENSGALPSDVSAVYGNETEKIPEGEYEVEYYIPGYQIDPTHETKNARNTWIIDNDITVKDIYGTKTIEGIKPYAHYEGWVKLGTYKFDGTTDCTITVIPSVNNNLSHNNKNKFATTKVKLKPVTGYAQLVNAVNNAAAPSEVASAVATYGGTMLAGNELNYMGGAYQTLINNKPEGGYTSAVELKNAYDSAVEGQLTKVIYNNENNILSYNGSQFRATTGNLLLANGSGYFITTFKGVNKQNVKRAEIKIPYHSANKTVRTAFKLTKVSSEQYDRPNNNYYTETAEPANYQAATAFAAGFTAVTEAQQMQVLFTPKEIDASLFTGEDGYFSLYFEKGQEFEYDVKSGETPLGATAELTVWYDNTVAPVEAVTMGETTIDATGTNIEGALTVSNTYATEKPVKVIAAGFDNDGRMVQAVFATSTSVTGANIAASSDAEYTFTMGKTDVKNVKVFLFNDMTKITPYVMCNKYPIN